MMVVNGRTWPYLNVEQRRYRFRLLNGCNSRFLILKMSDDGTAFHQIGSDQGFLPAPVELNELLMAPAERADVIVDFTNATAGSRIYLLNFGPDEPFGGGQPFIDFDPADMDSTGQVMEFRVTAANGSDDSILPTSLPVAAPLGPAETERFVTLHEEMTEPPLEEVPVAALLGTAGEPQLWMDPITENPPVGATEVWRIQNRTGDAHPIHVHLVKFEVLGRNGNGPEPWETGFKDTVIAYPGEDTYIKAYFDLPGFYVWHCHIVEHEDNEMMRPFHVGPIPFDSPTL